MALIKCPECGKEISDKSTACIHCGYPLAVDNNLYFLYAPMWSTNGNLRKLLKEVLGYTDDEIDIMDSQHYDRNIVNNLTIEKAKAITEIFLGNDFQIYLNNGGGCDDVIFWKDLGISLNKSVPKEHYCDEPLVSREQLADLSIPKMVEKPVITASYSTKPVVECPYCHSQNTKKVSVASKAGSVALWGIFSQKVKKQWHCNNCGSEW